MNEYDQNDPNAFQSPAVEAEKKPRGCLFYGCVISSVLLLLMVLAAVGVGVAGYYFAKGQIEAYTEEEPMELPLVEVTDEEVAEIKSRVEQLTAGEAGQDDAGEIVLTADDINALISANEDLSGRVFIRIEDGEVSGDVSIPTDFLPIGKGRYFNASASFEVWYERGELVVRLKDATVKGEPLPQEFLDAFAGENLAKDIDSPELDEALNKIESIEVEGDRIILRAKRSEPGEEAEGADGQDAENSGR